MSPKKPAEPVVLQKLLDTDQVAELLGKTTRAVENWRHFGGGPEFVRIGNEVKYRPEWIADWLEANKQQRTA